MTNSTETSTSPPIDVQREFWNRWNQNWRVKNLDEFMQRQLEVAVQCAQRASLRDARILDAGCGTGWLGAGLSTFGRVTGTDLSPISIEFGKQKFPEVELLCGDFLTMELDGPFDLIISADSLAHVYDQPAFVTRVQGLLRPGGVFLLMTQNPWVWNRKSTLAAREVGQIRNWPSLSRIRSLLASKLKIELVSSIVPGGDRGLLWWVENRYFRGGARILMGRQRWQSLLEKALLGRELVVVARG